MSTRSTISYGKHVHRYHEMYDGWEWLALSGRYYEWLAIPIRWMDGDASWLPFWRYIRFQPWLAFKAKPTLIRAGDSQWESYLADMKAAREAEEEWLKDPFVH